jgi:hypothetical protein
MAKGSSVVQAGTAALGFMIASATLPAMALNIYHPNSCANGADPNGKCNAHAPGETETDKRPSFGVADRHVEKYRGVLRPDTIRRVRRRAGVKARSPSGAKR